MMGIRILERTLLHVYKWQLKEYRLDRYRDYLNSRQGVWMLLHPWYWFGVAISFYVVAFLYFPSWNKVSWIFYSMAFYIMLSGISSLFQIMKKGLCRPQWTGRALLIVVLTPLIIIGAAFFLRANLHYSYIQLFSLLLTPVLVGALVFLTSFPANYFKGRTIEKAKAKMASLPNLKIIGITGSYGKSSTKEFLAQILSKKYKVVKTPKNQNSEIGVAQTVLRDVQPDHEIFIVEMGAYRRGEIKAICDIVHPSIGVLTAINEQHLSLFGSLATIRETKYELIDALPENGIAVFNGDNRVTRELAERTLKNIKVYSTERPADVTATAVTIQPEKLSFSVQTQKEKQHFISPLLGGFHVSNLLAAMTVAQTFGTTLAEIAETMQTIAPPEHTMALHHHPSGALIIDDSYSANPDGVLGALQHLKIIPRRYKVVVMMPMIELGSSGSDAHRRIGQVMGQTCDTVIMTQKNFGRILRKASGLPHQKFFFLSSPKAILDVLAPYLNGNSVILLENRLPQLLLKDLL